MLVLQNLADRILPYLNLRPIVTFSLCRRRPGMLSSLLTTEHLLLFRCLRLIMWWLVQIITWYDQHRLGLSVHDMHTQYASGPVPTDPTLSYQSRVCVRTFIHDDDQILVRTVLDIVKQYLRLMSSQHSFRTTIRRRPKSCAWLHNPNATQSISTEV